MTSGIPTDDEKRSQLSERDELIIQMMELGRPVRNIAQLIGIEHDYCRKICAKLSTKAGFEYKPITPYKRTEMTSVGITEATRRFRGVLGDKLYLLGNDGRQVAKLIGMTIRCQKAARQRPFNHDWTLSQIERLAAALGTDFATLMREALNV